MDGTSYNACMTELVLKLSLPDQLATQAKAAGLLTSEAIERLVRDAIRKAAAQRLVEYGRRLREPGGARHQRSGT